MQYEATPHIQELRLSQFRNIESLTLKSNPTPIVLWGPNGAGKTNILEALSFFSPGKGLKNESISTLNRQIGNNRFPWAAHIRAFHRGEITEIGTGQDPTANKDKRLIKINGMPAKNQKIMAEKIHVIWMTPAMDRLFVEANIDKRRFLDRLVYGIDPEHADRLILYEKKLRERVLLLQENRYDPQWLEQIETEIVKLGISILKARHHYLESLKPFLKEHTIFPSPVPKLYGKIEDFWELEGEEASQEFYITQLKALRPVDKEVGASRIGPHRTDLRVIEKKSSRMASFCSTGEQKGLLIAFLLAHCRLLVYKGKAPILLLDEVVAHLDPLRREALCVEIIDLNLQAWMTGTEAHFFDALSQKAQYFSIQDGKILEK